MQVGGREFGWSKHDVEMAMTGIQAETIREHFVEMIGTEFPPKQVIAEVSGWDRNTFTTQEARRVLVKLGFKCARAIRNRDGMVAWFPEVGSAADALQPESVPTDRIAVLEAAVSSAHLAIASLASRIERLEATK